MSSGGDSFGLAVLVMFAVVFVIALVFDHPWLLLCIAAAGLVYWLAKREERRERAGMISPVRMRAVSAGGRWLQDNRDSLPKGEWVAANAFGLVAHNADQQAFHAELSRLRDHRELAFTFIPK